MAPHNYFRTNLGVFNKYERHHTNGQKIMNQHLDSIIKNH